MTSLHWCQEWKGYIFLKWVNLEKESLTNIGGRIQTARVKETNKWHINGINEDI